MAYDWLQQRFELLTWKLAAFMGALALLIVHFASQSGLIYILIRMTFDPQTGYYRLLIWRFGLESIRENPLFGIGYAAYERYEWMSASVDAHWLLLGVRHGAFAAIAFLCLAVMAIMMVGLAAAYAPHTTMLRTTIARLR